MMGSEDYLVSSSSTRSCNVAFKATSQFFCLDAVFCLNGFSSFGIIEILASSWDHSEKTMSLVKSVVTSHDLGPQKVAKEAKFSYFRKKSRLVKYYNLARMSCTAF